MICKRVARQMNLILNHLLPLFILFTITTKYDLVICSWAPDVFPTNKQKYVNRPVVTDGFDYTHNSSTLDFPLLNVDQTNANLAYLPPRHSRRHDTTTNGNTVVGIALYENYLKGFKRLVGSLRISANFTGTIILGINPSISDEEMLYLKSMSVTLYYVHKSPCNSIDNHSVRDKKSARDIRRTCSRELRQLPLEWGRYEMARAWIEACKHCLGWALVIDTRDVFFQADPFQFLSSPQPSSKALQLNSVEVDLLFIEEIAPHTSPIDDPRRSFVAGNPRNEVHIVPCYGRDSYRMYAKRPVLCSGTVMGSRQGIMRFFKIILSEFLKNLKSENVKCHPPHTTDQWTLNWLYYHGRFGKINSTLTIPWGTGPVLTVGKACMTLDKKTGAKDIIVRNSYGQLLNNHEDGVVAPVVHQFDRCGKSLKSYLISQPWQAV